MDKYIKYEDIRECRFFQDEKGEWILHADIIKIPAADVVPIRHGKWIEPADPWCYKCSECHNYYNQENGTMPYRYCPYCGAKMDGGFVNVDC